jgi:hypothetical protein
MDVMEYLKAIPTTIIREKQRHISLLAPKLTYSAPPFVFNEPISSLSDDRVDQQWEPPFKDAASIALDGMFSRVERIQKGLPILIPELNLSHASWIQKYNTTMV